MRIFTTTSCLMTAEIAFISPAQSSQFPMSRAKTRERSLAQEMRFCFAPSSVASESCTSRDFSTSVSSSVFSSTICGTTSFLNFECGARIPWNLVRWILGGGTSAESFSRNSRGEKTTPVVPSRHGVLRR